MQILLAGGPPRLSTFPLNGMYELSKRLSKQQLMKRLDNPSYNYQDESDI